MEAQEPIPDEHLRKGVRFRNEEDKEKVLLEGPWNFFGRPIVFKQWNQDLKIEKEAFNTLPIWIHIPKLDLSLRDNETLGRIASVVGHPRFIDDSTADRDPTLPEYAWRFPHIVRFHPKLNTWWVGNGSIKPFV